MKKRKMKMSLGTHMKLRSSSQKNVVHSSTSHGIFELNDDCLAEIFRYLPLKDVVAIIQIDHRFRSAARFSYGGVSLIDREFLRDIPQEVRGDFYKVYGPRASRMTFQSMYWPELVHTIRHFPNLEEITLRHIYGHFRDEVLDKIELPGSLQVLKIDQCIFEDEILQKWFVQINATLTELEITLNTQEWLERKFKYLEELTNITLLTIRGDLPQETLAILIGNNKNHMRSLTLDRYGVYDRVPNDAPMSESLWRSMSSLQQLTELVLQLYVFNNIEPGLCNLWPELTSLRLDSSDASAIITRLGCQLSLNSLVLVNHTDDARHRIDFRILARFPNLRSLELAFFDWKAGMDDLSQVYQLKQVHYLDLNYANFDNCRVVMDLVANMPNLRNLMLENINFDGVNGHDEGEKEKMALEDYLKQRNPPLQFQLSLDKDN